MKPTSSLSLTMYGRIRMDTSVDTLDVKAKWELDANTVIADEEWESSWVPWQKCLSSSIWREFVSVNKFQDSFGNS